MGYDIFESISQGKHGEDAPQTGRMEEVADILRRSCANNEKEHGSGPTYGGSIYGEQGFVEISQYSINNIKNEQHLKETK